MRPALLAGVAAAALLLAHPAAAGEAVPGPLDWRELLGKTVVFETGSALIETGLFLAFFGAGTAAASGGAGGVFAVTFVTASLVYLANEAAWEWLHDPAADRLAPARLAGKAATYRIAATARSIAQAALLGGAAATGSLAYALTVAGVDTAYYVAMDYATEAARSGALRLPSVSFALPEMPWSRPAAATP